MTLNITQEQARADVQKFRESLQRALHALADACAVKLGATAREVVYTEDKVTLFRYRNDTARNSVTPAQAGVHFDRMDSGIRRNDGK